MSNSKHHSVTTDNISPLPRHVAIIMDGNGRWANSRHLPRFAGHRAGVEAVRNIVQDCAKRKIEALTLFAFSSENWRRPKKEVSLLMDLLMTSLQREVTKLHENKVCLKIIGDRAAFPKKLQKQIETAEYLTRDNDGLVLVVAVNYGGRWDITQAARNVAEQVAAGQLEPAQIDEGILASYMELGGLPEPDLFIRTGGEERISNFLLWHLAYTELYFTEILWPDFNVDAFRDALISFTRRQRRFGQTGEQVEQARGA
jgi:undecaprenyl diphosphate synthase